MTKSKGWQHESKRHSLASRGIKTNTKVKTPVRIMEARHLIKTRNEDVVRIEYDAIEKSKKVGYLELAVGEDGVNTTDSFSPYIKKSDAYINYVKTEEKHRNEGIGGKLLIKAEEKAKELGKKRILLEVHDSVKKPRWMYERRGYKQIAKSGKWNLMAKNLKTHEENRI